MVRMPGKFEMIARLSERERGVLESQSVQTIVEVTEVVMGSLDAQYQKGQPNALLLAMDALDEQEFRELMGWVLFGREYVREDGDPYQQLRWHIRNAIVRPRGAQSSYLEQKPIATYLRKAEEHLLGTPIMDSDEDLEEDD
jgi:hypothetical protein